MSVFIPIPVSELSVGQEPPSPTYKLDLEKGRIFSLGSCDGIEAVQQSIRKALLTPRFRCLIYDNQYGSEIKSLKSGVRPTGIQSVISNDVTREYIETELPRMVKDALSADSRILDVSGFSFEFEEDGVFISFAVNTIFGKTVIEEVL